MRRKSGVGGTLAMAVVVSALGSGGCASQRPLIIVEDSANDAWARGDLPGARAGYEEIVDRRPQEWRSRLMLARIAALEDRWEDVDRQIDIVYSFAAGDPEVLDLLAEAKLRTGQLDEMERELRNAAAVSGRWEDWLRLGESLARAGDLDGARGPLETAARLDRGQSVRPQLALARLHAEAGDEAAALRRYRMVLYLDPSSAEARSRIREAGEIPGPTLAVPPAESNLDPES